MVFFQLLGGGGVAFPPFATNPPLDGPVLARIRGACIGGG